MKKVFDFTYVENGELWEHTNKEMYFSNELKTISKEELYEFLPKGKVHIFHIGTFPFINSKTHRKYQFCRLVE